MIVHRKSGAFDTALQQTITTAFVFAMLLGCISRAALAQTWPTYRHDARRSGVTDHQLAFPLHQTWTKLSATPPQTAWTGPAKWDAYSGNTDLQSMRNFDPCFFVTAGDGRMFYGSSVDDAVHCLDARTGTEHWVFFTGAPVRFPPTLHSGSAYFGSDDGYAYCCDQASGKLVWKHHAATNSARVTSNRKIISKWPVRTGVLVQDGRAIFGASLVPWNKSYLWKVDAKLGNVASENCFRTEIDGVTLQGALLASSDQIFVPQGRAAPLAFRLADGQPLGAIGEAGGVFCVLTEDEMLLAGPQNQKATDAQMRLADTGNRKRLATFGGTNRILVSGENAWIPTGGKLKMLDRSNYVRAQIDSAAARAVLDQKVDVDQQSKQNATRVLAESKLRQSNAWKWQTECPNPTGFIKAGDSIVVGLKNEVRAYSSDTGKLLWNAPVEGMAYGLAVAEGRLFVSTGLGHLYAFEAGR